MNVIGITKTCHHNRGGRWTLGSDQRILAGCSIRETLQLGILDLSTKKPWDTWGKLRAVHQWKDGLLIVSVSTFVSWQLRPECVFETPRYCSQIATSMCFVGRNARLTKTPENTRVGLVSRNIRTSVLSFVTCFLLGNCKIGLSEKKVWLNSAKYEPSKKSF